MKDNIRSCLDQIAPRITKQIRGKPCPWMTPELKQLQSERDKLHRRHRKSKLPAHKCEYQRKKNIVNSSVKKTKQNYFKNLLENSANDPDSFWRNLKKIFPSKQKSSTSRFTINSVSTSDPKTIANAFCSYFSNIVNKLKTKTFVLKNCIWRQQTLDPLRTCKKFKFTRVTEQSVHMELRNLKRKKSAGLDDIPPSALKDAAGVLSSPLARIINLSFETGVFPTDWKSSRLTPVHKSGARDSINNYRPISVIPAISKIIERVAHRQLSSYLESNNLLNDCQFGFRKNRSTELVAHYLLIA